MGVFHLRHCHFCQRTIRAYSLIAPYAHAVATEREFCESTIRLRAKEYLGRRRCLAIRARLRETRGEKHAQSLFTEAHDGAALEKSPSCARCRSISEEPNTTAIRGVQQGQLQRAGIAWVPMYFLAAVQYERGQSQPQ